MNGTVGAVASKNREAIEINRCICRYYSCANLRYNDMAFVYAFRASVCETHESLPNSYGVKSQYMYILGINYCQKQLILDKLF